MGRSKANPMRMVAVAANVLVFGAVVTALYVAQDVFIPLTLSTMLAFLLAPLADRLERSGLSRIPAVLVLALITFSIIGGFLWVVGREATKLAGDIPQYQTEIVRKIENFSTVGSGTSKRLTQFASAVTAALRGSDRKPQTPAKSSAPVDDMDVESSRAVQKNSPVEQGQLGTAANPIYTETVEHTQSPMDTAFSAMGAVLSPLTNVGLVIVFTIFMLLSRDDLRDRLIRVISGGRYIVTTKAIDEASRRISGYILAQTIVNSVYGFGIGLGLWIIGLTLGGGTGFPNFALWGLLCTVMRFVPYVGPIIAGAFPIGLSLIVFPGFQVFAATAILITVLELLSNNVLEPWLYGSRTGMSPMAVIVAAVFWTWMWGPVGLLLSIPLTASLIVMGKYIPQLAPLTVLLGDRTPLPPDVSYYQRLLADDHPRAEKILNAAIDEQDLETAADELVIPTLRRIRRDRASGELAAPREHLLMESITTMIDHVLSQRCQVPPGSSSAENASSKDSSSTDADEPKEGKAKTNHALFASGATDGGVSVTECNLRVARAVQHLNVGDEIQFDSDSEAEEDGSCHVLGCTAHHESEEPVLKILSYCLSQQEIDMRWTGTKALPSDVESWVELKQPAVIVIAIVPPGGFVQAKYLCKQLHRCSPKSQIIVAYYGKVRAYDAMLIKFRAAGATYFSTSLGQTRTQVANALRRHGRVAATPAKA